MLAISGGAWAKISEPQTVPRFPRPVWGGTKKQDGMSVWQLDIQDPCFLLCAWHMHSSDFVTKENCQYEIFKLLLLDSHFSCVCLVGHVTLWQLNFGRGTSGGLMKSWNTVLWTRERLLKDWCTRWEWKLVAFVCVERRPKYGACLSWPAGYQLGGGRTHAKVGVVTPSLPSVPSALRTPRLLKRNVCMFHMSPHHPFYAVLADMEYHIG